MMKLAATLSVGAAALAATCVAYSPIAQADECPNVNDTASLKQAEGPFYQRYSSGDPQAAIDWANFLSSCATGVPYEAGPRMIEPVARPDLNPEPSPPTQASEPSNGVDCTQLKGAYDSLGPVVDIGDAVAKLNKMPGLSQVQGTSLALCGIDAIPNAIGNPSLENQQRVADASCGALSYFTSGIIDLCGTTPVGSH